VSDVTAREGIPSALPISVESGTPGGSLSLAVKITGVPAGASLSAGTQNADGSWVLSAGDLPGLQISIPEAGDFNLTVTAIATDNTSGASNTDRAAPAPPPSRSPSRASTTPPW